MLQGGGILASCEKDQVSTKTEVNATEEKAYVDGVLDMSKVNYVYMGKTLKSTAINWEDDSISIFYNADSTNNAYVFDSEEDVLEWLKTTEHYDDYVAAMAEVDEALALEEEMCPNETDEELAAFDSFMKKQYQGADSHKSVCGLGNLYVDEDMEGADVMIRPWPVRKIANAYDDNIESMYFVGNAIKFWDKKKYSGSSCTFYSVGVLYTRSFDDFNNKATSYKSW